MNYKKEDSNHILMLDKDELIMLISLVHEARESLRSKAGSSDTISTVKYEGAVAFVDELNRQIMRS
ncbi:MAG: hypothetical protein ACYCPW_05195 [Nitrososphaerales archaeon]